MKEKFRLFLNQNMFIGLASWLYISKQFIQSRSFFLQDLKICFFVGLFLFNFMSTQDLLIINLKQRKEF